MEEEIQIVEEWNIGLLICPECGKKIKVTHIRTPNWKPKKNFKRHKVEELM